jgi:hypothetical protein
VKCDDIELAGWFGEVCGYGVYDETVAYTVEAVFAEFVLLRDGLVDGICADIVGDCVMERRVEVGDVLSFWEDVGYCADDCECGRIVEWREIGELFDVVVCLFVDDLRFGVVASVYSSDSFSSLVRWSRMYRNASSWLLMPSSSFSCAFSSPRVYFSFAGGAVRPSATASASWIGTFEWSVGLL